MKQEPILDTNICFFGIHPCDANAIAILDKILLDSPEDTLYSIRRRTSLIVIHNCLKSDEYCFCKELGAHIPWNGSVDIWIVVKDNRYYVKALSNKGEEILQKLYLEKASSIPINEEYTITNTLTGIRTRTWNSCIFRSFTTVAGDKVFRSSRKGSF